MELMINTNRLRLLLALALLLFPGNLQSSCLSVPFPLDENVRTVLFQSFKTQLKENFDVDSFDNATPGTLRAEPIEFKIRRSRPLIGIPPTVANPKFKQQQLTCSTSINDSGTICVSLESRVYNRRDKQWYPVKSDGRLEQQILEPVVPILLNGHTCWVLGSLPGTINNMPSVLHGGTRVQVASAVIIQQGVKHLQLDLITPEQQIFTYSINFAGDTDSIPTVLESFFHRFAWKDPLQPVPQAYTFFNAYARQGELMDGMVPAQVLVALGKPTTVTDQDDGQIIWHYPAASGYETLLFQDGELVLSR